MLTVVVVRGLVLIIGADSLQDDPDAYARLAVNLAESGGLGFEDPTDGRVAPSAFRPPLYPLVLSLLVFDGECSRLGIAGLHLLLGTLSVWLVLSIGRKLGVRWAPVAALAFAVDPLLLRQSQLVMTETLATCLALIVWRLWLALPAAPAESNGTGDTRMHHPLVQRGDPPTPNGDTPLSSSEKWSWTEEGGAGTERSDGGLREWRLWAVSLLLGVFFGLSILCRPTAAPWALLCTLGLLGARCAAWEGISLQKRWVVAVLVALGVAGNVGAWTLRNWAEFGRPIWATTHGGYTLLLANNPSLYQHFAEHGPSRNWQADPFHAAWAARGEHPPEALVEGSYWLREVEGEDDKGIEVVGWSELENDRVAYAAARATIEREPGMFFLSSLYRIGWLWAWWPNVQNWGMVLAIGGWYAAWSLAALFTLVRGRSGLWWWGWLPVIFLACSLTAVHSIYWSNMRMRCPVVAGAYLLAIARGGASRSGVQD